MVTYNKFNSFSQALDNNQHNFSSGTYKVMLVNATPIATYSVYSNVSSIEIPNGNGYSTGGITTTITENLSGGTHTIFASNVTFTANGTLGPVNSAIVYRSDDLNKGLVCWFEYGSNITLSNNSTLTVQFNQTSGLFSLN